jgi:ribosome-binding factor A
LPAPYDPGLGSRAVLARHGAALGGLMDAAVDGEKHVMLRGRVPAGGEQSQRQLRVGEGLRHVLAELLSRGAVHDPVLSEASLTISEVQVSRDLRHATVFVTELGGALRPELRAALTRVAPYLRGEAARRMHLKYAPELHFRVDPAFAQAARIDALLAEERAALARLHEDQDEPA